MTSTQSERPSVRNADAILIHPEIGIATAEAWRDGPGTVDTLAKGAGIEGCEFTTTRRAPCRTQRQVFLHDPGCKNIEKGLLGRDWLVGKADATSKCEVRTQAIAGAELEHGDITPTKAWPIG